MATGILGLGSTGSLGLNQELIDKLKNTEVKSYIDPIDLEIEKSIENEEKIKELGIKLEEFKKSLNNLSLNNLNNVFDDKSITLTGNNINISVIDEKQIVDTNINIEVKQLATKDVFQTNEIDDETNIIKSEASDDDNITINFKGVDYIINIKDKTYKDLSNEINNISGITSSIEQVSDETYRLIIKSDETGLENKINITENGVDLGINNVLVAQNNKTIIDGIEYDMSMNSIEKDGLNFDFLILGETNISIKKDDSQIATNLKDLTNKYNELIYFIDNDLNELDDRYNIRGIKDSIKNSLFSTNSNGDNIFNKGFELDKEGNLSINEEILNNVINNDKESLKNLFIGSYEEKGLGINLEDNINELFNSNGLYDILKSSNLSKQYKLNNEKEKEQKRIDDRYLQMSLEFANYTAIITQMEASFSGMKMMIENQDN